jgi:predicted patatin/cPLA2 family phospholipase
MARYDNKPLWQLQIERILDSQSFKDIAKISREEWDKYDSCWEHLEDPPEEWSNIFAQIISQSYQKSTLQETLNLVFHMGQVWEIYKNSKRGQDNAKAQTED